MRELIAKADGSFTAAVLRHCLIQSYPHLADRVNNVSVNLIDMANRGELLREGKGRNAVYKKARLKTDLSPKEAAYRKFRETIPTPGDGRDLTP
jgi:hypothetical protein